MPPITVVTCTGGRPELFALCRRWVLRQSMPVDRWIVTTDVGDQPNAPEAEVFAVPRDFLPTDHQPQREHRGWKALRALCFALSKVKSDSYVVVMEDDDWYGPDYVKTLVETDHWLPHQQQMHLCHLPAERYGTSLADNPVEGYLAFRPGNQKRILSWLLAGHPRPKLDSRPVSMQQFVQVKGVGFGLPGRSGATRKHIADHRKVLSLPSDPGNQTFQRLVGGDAGDYLRLLKR